MKRKSKIKLLFICSMALLLVACSSAIDTFSSNFEGGKYAEALEVYQKDIRDNAEKEKALEDYLLPRARENLESYKADKEYKNSTAEEILDNMTTYVSETTRELENVLDEYKSYRSSRRAYITGKEKMASGNHEEALKLFEEVMLEDIISQDVEALKDESYREWQGKVFQKVDSFLENSEYAEAISLLKSQEKLLKGNSEYILVLEKAKDLKQKDEEEKAAQEEKARLEVEEKEKRLAASLSKMRIEKDEVKRISWYYDKTSPKYVDTNDINLYIGEDEEKNNPWLRLSIQYRADSWLFIESYTIRADENVYTIKPQAYRDIERDNGGGSIWEWYDTSPTDKQIEMVKEIIKSNKTIIRHEGKQYYDDREVTAREKKALQNVLDAYEYLEREKL